MRGAIMQPTYLPWMGYFSMIDEVDVFVFLDNVQLVKRSWQVRNRIKECDGKELMLTIPIKHRSRNETMVCNALFSNDTWKREHCLSIAHCYKKSKYFHEVMFLLNRIYNSSEYSCLSEFNIACIRAISSYLGIKTEFITSSDIEGITGNKDELLVSICKRLGIDYYLSALGSAVYIEKNNAGGAFGSTKVKLEYQNYEHPVYNQLGKEFMPFMGIIDVMFNCGDKSLEVIRSGRRRPFSSSDLSQHKMS